MIITSMASNLVEDLALEYVGNATSEDQFEEGASKLNGIMLEQVMKLGRRHIFYVGRGN